MSHGDINALYRSTTLLSPCSPMCFRYTHLVGKDTTYLCVQTQQSIRNFSIVGKPGHLVLAPQFT